MTIIFYDIPSSEPNAPWSPNTWKVRFALNYKGIPYKTEWVDYPDIEAHAVARSLQPTGKWPQNGKPYYSLPAIYDPSTETYIADSFKIVLYLEKTYPNTPRLFPEGANATLQSGFIEGYSSKALDGIWMFVLPFTPAKLTPPGAEYFERTRKERFGKALKDLIPTGEDGAAQWAKVKQGFETTDGFYKAGGDDAAKSVLVLGGDTPVYADIVVASYLLWMKIVWGVDDDKWKDIASWNGGRWGKLVDKLTEEYGAVL